MSRKKRRRYKLLHPEAVAETLPPRVQAVVTIVQWMFWLAMAGVFIAFGLILSLYTHWRINGQVWLKLWPASIQLMTAGDASPQHLARLALWATVENGLIYGAGGIILGTAWALVRYRRRRRHI